MARRRITSPVLHEHLNFTSYPLEEYIDRAINRRLFILLDVIDRDLLIYAICKGMREKVTNDPEFTLPVDDDILEDEVAKCVENISKMTFITPAEMEVFFNILKKRMYLAVGDNENQKSFKISPEQRL